VDVSKRAVTTMVFVLMINSMQQSLTKYISSQSKSFHGLIRLSIK